MIRLRPVKVNNKKLFHEIAKKKQFRNPHCSVCGEPRDVCENCLHGNRGKMLRMEEDVFRRYDFYEAHTNDLNAIQPVNILNGEEAQLIRDSYEHSTAFQDTRKKIFDAIPPEMQGKCPFCMISEPTTLEHYFPESVYPEYILYAPNLVPCCSHCNELKGTSVFDDHQTRRIIHFYFDDLPEETFLKAAIRIEDGIPIVQFTLEFAHPSQMTKIVQNHFEALQLQKRYQRQVAGELSTICREIREYTQNGLPMEMVRTILRARMNSFRRTYGENYWKASLYEALLEEDEAQLQQMVRSA